LFISIILFLALPLVVSDKDLFNGGLSDSAEALDSLVNVAADQINEAQDSGIVTNDILIESIVNEMVDGVHIDSIVNQKKEDKENVNWTFNKNPDRSIIQFSPGDTSGENAWTKTLELVEEGTQPREAVDSMFTSQGKWTRVFLTQGIKLQTRKGEGLVSAFLDKASYTLFIFLPIFALFLKMLYIRRKRFYIEHLIFSLHYFSFFFFLIILYVLIYKFIGHFPLWPVFIISLIYLYISMIKVYKQRWGRTLFKWVVLNLTTVMLFLPVFFVFALLFSLMFY